jgi:membrane associated rhomboid family serine protease
LKPATRVPFVTLSLIAVNIIVAFVMLLRAGGSEDFGFLSSAPTLISVFTSIFVHANVLHLMGNMIFLAAVGAAVEIATGSLRFLAVYLLSGLGGILVFWLSTRMVTDGSPLVGASGCIAGCATYYSVRYTKFRVPLAPKRSATVAGVTIAWLVLQVAGALITIGEPVHRSGFFAHLGGAMLGLLLGVFFRSPDLGDRKLGHQVLEALNDRGVSVQIQHAQNHLKDHPEDIEMQLRLAEQYREIGDHSDEGKTLLAVLFVLSGESLHATIIRLFDLKLVDQMSPQKRRQLADRVEKPLAIKLLSTVASMPKSEKQRPEALLELSKLLTGDDSARMVDLLRADYPTHPATEIAKKMGLR